MTKIKDIRKSMGLTQVEVAEKAGLSYSYYSEIERGIKRPNQYRMKHIAKALNVRTSVLMDPDVENIPTEIITRDQRKLLDAFDRLTDKGKDLIWRLIGEMRKQDEP